MRARMDPQRQSGAAVREHPAPWPNRRYPMSSSHPSATVTLSLEHRDALRDHISGYFDDARELASIDCEPENKDRAREIVRRLSRSFGLLDQIGWEVYGRDDRYTVELDSEIVALLEDIDRSARESIRRRRGSPFAVLIDDDLDALSAVRIMREAI
jgi:hypothetical protein